MALGDIVVSVAGWVVMLGAAPWYVRRTKHPDRKLASAFGVFLGIFGGITLAGLSVIVGIWFALGLENSRVPGAAAAVFALPVVIPAWRAAVGAIRRPGKESSGNV